MGNGGARCGYSGSDYEIQWCIKGKFSITNGAYTLVSDRRLKKDITPVQLVLDKLMQVKAYQYHYLDNNLTDPLSHGFIAQDVEKIFPSFVSTAGYENGKEILGIDYNNFIVIAIRAIQEQQIKLEWLNGNILDQESTIKKQENIIQSQDVLISEQQRLMSELETRLHSVENKIQETQQQSANH